MTRYFVGNGSYSVKYAQGSFEKCLEWLNGLDVFQFDIETNVAEHHIDRRLITLQFGDLNGTTQWCIQWSSLCTKQQQAMLKFLDESPALKLIQNAMFECVFFRFMEIELKNIYCTFIAEKVLYGGEDNMGYDLGSLTQKYLNKELSGKDDVRLSFGDDVMTEEKILYSFDDVTYLGFIRRMQLMKLSDTDLDWVAALEMEVLLSYAEMTWAGLPLDKDGWLSNIDPAQKIIDESKAKLDAWILQEPFYSVAKSRNYVSEQDRVLINWNSPTQRKLILSWIFPDMVNFQKPHVKKYLTENQFHPMSWVLEQYLEGDCEQIESFVVSAYYDKLVASDLLIPANTVVINWNSVDQTLPICQAVSNRMKDMSAETFAKQSHPIFLDIASYKDNLKLVTTYGAQFIEKYVQSDGYVRTSINPLVSTGRASSKNPNMQNIPAKEAVGTRYRNAFIAEPGWVYVDSDFASQELVVIAWLSKDPVWIKALQSGQDLHSVCAELVYGGLWVTAAEPDCAFYKGGLKKKCGCKKHKTMRNGVKTINFGLAYGMSAFKLAATLRISSKEAEVLIEEYFRVFPNIKRLLERLGRRAVTKGYSMTMAPFFRKRFYYDWEHAVKYVPAHLSGVEYNPILGSIERAGKNQPIQGSSADMIKLASVFIRWWIRENNLSHKIKQAIQVHDQNTTRCTEDIAPMWKDKLDELMREAAKVFIPTGLLGAETTISPVWTK